MPTATAKEIYYRAKVEWPCEPISLAQRLGLCISPLQDRSHLYRIVPEPTGAWLLYRQEDHGSGDNVGPRTGLNVYRGIVAYHGGDEAMLGELVLPMEIMRRIPLAKILEMQVFAPKNYLIARYSETNGSGMRPRPR